MVGPASLAPSRRSAGSDRVKPITGEGRALGEDLDEWIVNGEICRMRELARRVGLNRHYTSCPLVNLSPQLTEAALKGDHPPTLTVAQLTADVAMDWSRQYLPLH